MNEEEVLHKLMEQVEDLDAVQLEKKLTELAYYGTGDEGYELFCLACLLCYKMVGLGFNDRATVCYLWAADMARASQEWAKEDMEGAGEEPDLSKFSDKANGLWGY